MSSGDTASGYTIVESMVFLAITGVLFIVAMLTINGQQQRAETAQALRQFHSRIDDVINDVSTGFYPDKAVNCEKSGGRPTLQPLAGVEQGKNKACVFIGKVVQFRANESRFNIFTVAGLRENEFGGNAASFAETKPVAVVPVAVPGGGLTADLTNTDTLRAGLEVTKLIAYNPAHTTPVSTSLGAIGFFSNFNRSGADTAAGLATINTMPIYDSDFVDDDIDPQANTYELATRINGLDSRGDDDINPKSLVICVQYAGASGKQAAVIIGSKDRQTTTELHIDDVTTAVEAATGGAGGETC